MSGAPANNSKCYWLLPVCAVISCRKKQTKQTIENIIRAHSRKCLMLESYERVQGLFMIIAPHRFVDSQPLSLQPHLNLQKANYISPVKTFNSLVVPSSAEPIKKEKWHHLSKKCQHNKSLIWPFLLLLQTTGKVKKENKKKTKADKKKPSIVNYEPAWFKRNQETQQESKCWQLVLHSCFLLLKGLCSL